jgi:hypothetical protein
LRISSVPCIEALLTCMMAQHHFVSRFPCPLFQLYRVHVAHYKLTGHGLEPFTARLRVYAVSHYRRNGFGGGRSSDLELAEPSTMISYPHWRHTASVSLSVESRLPTLESASETEALFALRTVSVQGSVLCGLFVRPSSRVCMYFRDVRLFSVTCWLSQ